MLTKEHKEKIRQAHLGVSSGMLGKQQSEDAKERIRLGNIGKHSIKHTDETKAKISAAGKLRKGLPSLFKGKTYEEIGRGPSPLLGRDRPQEERDKISASHLARFGSLAPSGDRDGPLAGRWKLKVKERDNYACQHCFIKQNEIVKTGNNVTDYLNAHHIKSWKEFPELRFDVANGITLCWPCHLKVEDKEISCPEPKPIEKKVRIVGRTLEEIHGLEKASKIRKQLSLSHIGQASWSKGKTFSEEHKQKLRDAKKDVIPWNKGKTNLELHGPEKAKELSLFAAENARKNRNRLGTGKKEIP